MFFIIWLQGCYLVSQNDVGNNQTDILVQYLTLSNNESTQSITISDIISKNIKYIKKSILKLHPYYLMNQFVYIFDGYDNILQKKCDSAHKFLHEIF